MRRKEKEMRDKSQIEAVIKGSTVCRLAMVDQGSPYVIPMSFGYDGAHLYFHSALEGRKIAVLKNNPQVCFEFDEVTKLKKDKDACEWGMVFKSVIGEGTAAFVEDRAQKAQGLDVIMAQYSKKRFEFPKESLEKTAVIKVAITHITGKQSL